MSFLVIHNHGGDSNGALYTITCKSLLLTENIDGPIMSWTTAKSL